MTTPLSVRDAGEVAGGPVPASAPTPLEMASRRTHYRHYYYYYCYYYYYYYYYYLPT